MRFRFKCCLLPACLLLLLASARGFAQPLTFTFSEADLPALDYSAIAYVDVDADGDLDVVVSGNQAPAPPFQPVALILVNHGAESSTGQNGRTITRHRFEQKPLGVDLWHAAIAPGDFDGDNRVDLVIAGTETASPPFQPRTLLLQNDGDGGFREVSNDFEALYGGAAAWGDYDGDGDLDLLLTGVTASGSYATRLYENRGGGSFSEVSTTGLPDVAFGEAEWADYDGDGDADLLLSGAMRNGFPVGSVFRNDSPGVFSEIPLAGLMFSDVSWGDYDNDGDLDVLISGGVLGPEILSGVAKVFRNDAGRFVEVKTSLPGVLYGTADWGDYDHDGDLDVLTVGAVSGAGMRIGRVYQQTDDGTFIHRINLPGALATSSTWADLDSDHDLDFLLTGISNQDRPVTGLYRNTRTLPNQPPSAPGGLRSRIEGGAVILEWDAASDVETPAAGLSYSVRIGTKPGLGDVRSAVAEPDGGRRYVTGIGNAGPATRLSLRNLPAGTYYWSVQAVDHSFAGSPFAEEQSFSVAAGKDGEITGVEDEDPAAPRAVLYDIYPNPFNESVTIRYEVPGQVTVHIEVFDVLGRRIAVLASGLAPAGRQEVTWDGRDVSGRRVPPGLYFVRLSAGTDQWTARLVRVD